MRCNMSKLLQALIGSFQFDIGGIQFGGLLLRCLFAPF